MSLIDFLIQQGVLRTPRIIEAFRVVRREDFVAEDMKEAAKLDQALPIGAGQTISQPYVVAFMLEHLQPKEGDTILDVGAGSGWTTALLSHIVGENGRVIGIELVKELATQARTHVNKYSFIEKGTAEIIQGDGRKGYLKEAPYDNILVSASMETDVMPPALAEQLKKGGRIVIPIKESIWVFEKKTGDSFAKEEYPGFVFVPLLQEQ